MRLNELTQSGGCCAAFGCFDGMLPGHRTVLRRLVAESREREVPAVLATFPARTPVLTTEREKALLAEREGIKDAVSCPDCAEAPGEFLRNRLAGELGVRMLVLGAGLEWNGHTCGEIADIARGNGTEVLIVDDGMPDGGASLSARLHDAIRRSDFEGYAALCGSPYLLTGRVIHGKGLGHTVGMPTANLEAAAEKYMPEPGVYAGIVRLPGRICMGLTSIGRRPSVDDEDRISVETHLLDFDGDLYGEFLRLELCFRIRGVRKFANLREVRSQVERDAAQSRKRLAAILDAQSNV